MSPAQESPTHSCCTLRTLLFEKSRDEELLQPSGWENKLFNMLTMAYWNDEDTVY